MIAVTIMHAPWVAQRAARIRALEAQTGGQVVNAVNGAGVWDTARRAWACGAVLAKSTGASHVVVIQDDVIPCARWRKRTEEALAARPNSVVSFYCHPKAPVAAARAAGASWCWGKDCAYGQASALPLRMVKQFLEWSAAHIRPEYKHDDNRLALFARSLGLGVWITVPQLVDHEQIASSLGHGWGGRAIAPWFLGNSMDPIDWGRQSITPESTLKPNVSRTALLDPAEMDSWPECRP